MITGGLDWGKGRGRGPVQFKHGFTEEDKSNDWYCDKCRERNFAKRTQCIKCFAEKPAEGGWKPMALRAGQTLDGMVKSYNRRGFGFLMVLGEDTDGTQELYYTRENVAPSLDIRDIPGEHVTFEVHRQSDGKLTAINIRPQGGAKPDARQGVRGAGYQPKQHLAPDVRRRAPSPVGGSRAYKDTLIAEMRQRHAERAAGRKSSGSSSSPNGSSSSASSERPARKKKRKKKKRRSSSSSSSSSVAVSEAAAGQSDAPATEDPGVGRAKAEALEELLRLRDRQPLELRMSEFRALLRKWHPDKNPDRKDLATAVFQFLQRGKTMLDAPKAA